MKKTTAFLILAFPFAVMAAQQDELRLPPPDSVAVPEVSAPQGKSIGSAIGHAILAPFAREFFEKTKDISGQAVPAALRRRETVAKLSLAEMLDKYLFTDFTFTTRAGKLLRISATKVANCAGGDSCDDMTKFFVTFATDSGEVSGANGYKIANYFIKSGYQDLDFDGDRKNYRVKLYADMGTPTNSILEIKQGSKTYLYSELGTALEAFKARGAKVKLSKDYLIYHSREFRQDSDGNLVSGKQGKTMFLAFSPDSTSNYYFFSGDSVTETGVSFKDFEPDYVFRKTQDGFLEILKK